MKKRHKAIRLESNDFSESTAGELVGYINQGIEAFPDLDWDEITRPKIRYAVENIEREKIASSKVERRTR